MTDATSDSLGSQLILPTGSKDKRRFPRWVPLTLLAISSAALVVPIVLLRRHRAATLGKALAHAPPPPRRTTSSRGTPMVKPTTSPPIFSVRDPVPSSSSVSSSLASGTEDGFNGALHCAKAFSVATLLVGTGAAATVWGVRQYMGVQTTQEFADRMRNAILTRMPMLSSRIHRQPQSEDGDAPLPYVALSPSTLDAEVKEPWTWPAAERRLKEAYEEHGFSGWFAAVMRELEAEGQIEREKRGVRGHA